MISLTISWAFIFWWLIYHWEIFNFRKLQERGDKWLIVGFLTWSYVIYTAIATYGYLLN